MTKTVNIIKHTQRRLAAAPDYDSEIQADILMDMAQEITADAFDDLAQKNKSLRRMCFYLMVCVVMLLIGLAYVGSRLGV